MRVPPHFLGSTAFMEMTRHYESGKSFYEYQKFYIFDTISDTVF